MRAVFPTRPTLGLPMLAIFAGLITALPSFGQGGCLLPREHAGVAFPVQQVAARWACRLQPIVSNYTTANKIGPIRTNLPPSLYRYLLDRPPLAAALINRLDLGLYQAERRGPGRYWGHDGEGTSGIVELAYQDATSRIYYLEGAHDSRLLPHVTGKAAVFLKMTPVREADGSESMDTTLVAYTRLDSRLLSGLVSLLRPVIGGTVRGKLVKGVETVNRLAELMRHQPDRVLLEAADPPGFPDEDVAFLKRALMELCVRPCR
jgi:hypothetical protein